MIIVLQRVKEAWVEAGGRTAGRIGRGICLLVGVEKGDSREDSDSLARKATELRIFPDGEGRMNRSLSEVGGEVLAVSQFTLAGSIKKGRRPSFDGAEEPGAAAALFEDLVVRIRQRGFRVETGIFQAEMNVHLNNDGPVTFVLESRKEGEKEKPVSR
ncbi:MAG: D-tyrosyl-tRNA(Tyr) deacylase [Candidatus Aminicenantes bacterium]|nr:D-tyrosyl-tRNA(Tyr) deacylase [Candidatus Aminicenantes bacterium]